MSSKTTSPLAQRLLGAVDLAVDFATLGQYGLEPSSAGGFCRERPGRKIGWEALPTARPRGAYPRPELPLPDRKGAPLARHRARTGRRSQPSPSARLRGVA